MSRPSGTRSRWINGDTPPNEPGVYERQIEGLSIMLNRFDGTHWFVGQKTVDEHQRVRSGYQAETMPFFRWRGLAAKPKA